MGATNSLDPQNRRSAEDVSRPFPFPSRASGLRIWIMPILMVCRNTKSIELLGMDDI